MDEVKSILAEIKDNKVAAEAEMERVRADKNLSPEGKRNKLTEIYSESVQKHKQLVSRYNEEVSKLKEDIAHSLYMNPFSLSFDTPDQIREMRCLVEKVEAAYLAGEAETDQLMERATVMRDKELIRAISGVAYAKKDMGRLQHLANYDDMAKKALEFESEYGENIDNTSKLSRRLQIRGLDKPAEISQSDANALL